MDDTDKHSADFHRLIFRERQNVHREKARPIRESNGLVLVLSGIVHRSF